MTTHERIPMKYRGEYVEPLSAEERDELVSTARAAGDSGVAFGVCLAGETIIRLEETIRARRDDLRKVCGELEGEIFWFSKYEESKTIKELRAAVARRLQAIIDRYLPE